MEKAPYRGKYPDRIKACSSFLRAYGEKFASLLIETNEGAKFNLVRVHTAAPLPKPGQEIEFWLYHVTPADDLAHDTFMRYGVKW